MAKAIRKPKNSTEGSIEGRKPRNLNPDDPIECVLTVEVALPNGNKAWPKVGVTTAVRADETEHDAYARAESFVFAKVDQLIDGLEE